MIIRLLPEQEGRNNSGRTGIADGTADLHAGSFFNGISIFIFHPVKQKNLPSKDNLPFVI
jgi:hypothetical protein